jgi:ATP-dependent DNA helicase RecG
MQGKLKQFINDGEGLTVEFKRCQSELSNSVFETVASFSNRYGGYVLLGVEDSGDISGVNPKAVSNLKKNFVNSLNNPNRFAPTLFISLEEAEIDGQLILWCYVPPTSQIVLFNGKIYDRAVDGDIDITRNTEMVSQIYMRKKADYSERKLFPYANAKDFDFERLMPIVRRLATHHHPAHPWEKMSDMEIIRSAGLYQEDHITGQSGYNLAAVLLFGRDELILSCTANYVTDAICRREDLNRYDDRLIVKTNLIDAFDQLMDFIAKHTLDRFFLIDGLSVSVRSKIARELVSNILVHREYTSAFPAKIIIERDRIVTENWSLPKSPGRIDPNNFAPYPKNPLLAQFFINIGRADVLGSGVRNLYKYTKIYSGGEPELIDDDVFKTIVPLSMLDATMSDNVSGLSDNEDCMSDNVSGLSDNEGCMSDNVSDMSDNVSDNIRQQAILAYLSEHGEINAATTAKIIGRSPETARRLLSQLADEGIVVASGANRNRVYRLKTSGFGLFPSEG